jgi:outer membrane autotransporter protein
LRFQGSDNTLKLLAGSNIQGNLELGGTSNTLIIGRGLDTALAFTGTPTIRTEDIPFLVIGNTVYAVNVTGFSVQDEMTNDLTRAVTGAVEGRLAQARMSGGGLSMAMNGMTIAAAADVSVAPQNGIWFSGFGAYRDQEEDGNVADFEATQLGAVGGFDGMLSDSTRAGLFAGLAFGSLDDGDETQDLDSDSYFGGAYLGHEWGQAFVDLTLTAGWSAFDSRRRVANNMVPGGIEHAEADYGGILLSPSLRIGTDMEMGSGLLTPSLRLRYAGLFLEGYEEEGSAADLDVEERTISVLDVRGELAYGFAAGSLQNTLRVGLDGTLSNSDDAEATLAGQALDIDVAEEALLRGFLGYDAEYALSDAASLTLSTEAGYDTAEALTLEARAGFSWTF